MNLGTNPLSNDSDGDGLDDMYEVVTLQSSPLLKDTDSDGLNDSFELEVRTNPTLADTDDDGLDDGWEYEYREFSGVNPLISASGQELANDYDSDGLSLLEESIAGTDPGNNDTDGDKLNDKWETIYQEYIGIDPLERSSSSSLSSDSDGDGLTLLNESIVDTDPASSDTDKDGLGDGWELTYIDANGVDPVVKATEAELESDQDNDRLTLLEEAQRNKNPNKADNPSEEPSDNESTEDFASSSFSYLPWVLVTVTLVLILCTVIIAYNVRKRRSKRRKWKWRDV